MKRMQWVKVGLHVAVVVGLGVAAAKYVNGESLLQAAQQFSYPLLSLMSLLVVTYFLMKAWRFVILLTPFARDLASKVIFKAYISGQAATLVPGGIAARAGLLHQVGVPVADSSVPIAMHSFWDFIMFTAGAVLAALWFESVRLPVLALLGGVSLLVVLLLWPRPRAWLAQKGEAAAARFHISDHWQRFWAALPTVFTPGFVLICLALTFLTFALEIGVLFLSLRGLGVTLTLPQLILTFIVPTFLGRLIPVMGGIGVTEAGMVGFLTGIAAVNTDVAVLAVAIFRILTIVLPVVLGAFVYFFTWRGEREVDLPGKAHLEIIPANPPDF